jgi:hypothetical protein
MLKSAKAAKAGEKASVQECGNDFIPDTLNIYYPFYECNK